jgi:hypothetical protein
LKVAAIIFLFAMAFSGGEALAENWVVVDDAVIGASVDQDSIRRGDDKLVYFTAQFADVSDDAVDCERGLIYTLKLHVMDGIAYPNWREEGRKIVTGSPGDSVARYVCARAQ